MEKSVQNHSLPCCPAEFPWGAFSQNLCSRARGWNSAAQEEGSRSQRRDREEAGAYRDQQRSVLSAAFFILLSTVAVVSELTLSLCFFTLPSVPRLHYSCLPSFLELQLFTEGKALEQLLGCVNSGPPSTASLHFTEWCMPVTQGLSTFPAHSPAKWDASVEFSQTGFVHFLQHWVVFWWCGHILSL